jgi:hypothetical protein
MTTDDTDQRNRDKLLTTIKALFSKTVEAGATEAEEMAAAEKARELLDKYQIVLGAEELKREGFVRKTVTFERMQFAFARRIVDGLEAFCEVRTWYNTYAGLKLTVFGLASDADLAVYLVESLTTFALAGANVEVPAQRRKLAIAYGPLTAAESREVHRSYLLGCADRIETRLLEMAKQRKAQATKPGTPRALVALDKPAVISAEMERWGIHLCAGSGLRDAANHDSFRAGSAHGAKANFGRPVRGGRVAGLIERKS